MCHWQRDFARQLITGHGAIVANFFDVGHSRRQAWAKRPQTAALLAALANPDRKLDAMWSENTSGRSTATISRRWRPCSSITERSGDTIFL